MCNQVYMCVCMCVSLCMCVCMCKCVWIVRVHIAANRHRFPLAVELKLCGRIRLAQGHRKRRHAVHVEAGLLLPESTNAPTTAAVDEPKAELQTTPPATVRLQP